MAKLRVYELAKELGLDSRALMTRLGELGVFVRSASSPIEPDVVRRLRTEFPVGSAAVPGSGFSQRVATPEVIFSPPLPEPRTYLTRQRRNPFAGSGAPPLRGARRNGAGRARRDAEEVFGAEAVTRTSRDFTHGRETYPDGYGWAWQRHVIDHETYVEFLRVGVEPHEADLANECLLAGMRPAELMTRLGEKCVIEWLRDGQPAEKVAGTLAECRQDPRSRHLVVDRDAPGVSTRGDCRRIV